MVFRGRRIRTHVFNGQILLDGRTFHGEPLGFGVQGHNCGYRHRKMWTWAHCIFPESGGRQLASFEALEYEIPLGLRFRKAILGWRDEFLVFRNFRVLRRDPEHLRWAFECTERGGAALEVSINGSGASLHRLPYLKTDCSSTFEVANNRFASAVLCLKQPHQSPENVSSEGGAVLEMVGR